MDAVIYVQPSDNSLRTAQFVRNNIDNIQRAGLRVRMEKVPDDTDSYVFKKLEEKGIGRLPALVSGQVVKIGHEKIVEWFTAMRPQRTTAAPPQQRRPQDDMESFMKQTLQSGEDEDDMGEGNMDLARKANQMAEVRKAATPKPKMRAVEPPHEENVRRTQPVEDFSAQDQDDMLNAYMQQAMHS